MVKNISLDYDGLSEEASFDLWADAIRPLFDITFPGRGRLRPARFSRFWLLDRIALSETDSAAQIYTRTKRHCKNSAETLAVSFHYFGGFRLEIDNGSLDKVTGSVNVMDLSRPHRMIAQASHHRTLFVAHDLVGYDPGSQPPTLSFRTDTPIGRVLFKSIEAVFEGVDELTEAEAQALANGLIGLLRSVLFSDPFLAQTKPAFRIARAKALRAYINQNIRSDRLTIDTICAQFNLSRATLYRDFKDEGGVHRYIHGRRLEGALACLALAPTSRGTVARAAEAWGFSSTTHFSREFRRRFGFAPSEVVGVGRQKAAAQMDGEARSVGKPGQVVASFLERL